ncbi:Long-chain-fatty-acid--CoA ligase [Marinomonas gallaica]|uniref:Long-chain-fatty-acid--CoA ligase n=1 Tax=Marinomonas gallaica TaxID=1806667 RepID=A0A1C3JMA9_9GAMM|nr:AMP-binding protein [Marinomonas gallaica]SBT16342.1 Long-chain-fatty-acid--CoA ligase [Marinomonas gallaica]SBT21390.1 Long-chain-fatty-acid--CoA ligase [Marinomonas gallaica]
MQLIERIKQHTGIALVDAEQTVSYVQLVKQAEQVASQLAAHQLVALVMENSVVSIIDYLACLMARAPMILLSDITQLELYTEYQPNFLLHSNQVSALTPLSVGQKTHDDLRLLLSTSGSTGSPKMVRLSAQNLDANTAAIVEYLELDSTARSITSLPLTYSFGLSILNSYLWVGASLVVTKTSITDKAFWTLMKEQAVTSLSGVPFHFETLQRLRFFNMSLPALKVFTQAGGKLRNEVLQAFAEHCQANGLRFYVMYGQTEAAPRISYLPPEHLLEKIGSIGISVPEGKLTLVDENGGKITELELEGELVYQGENVMMGYASSRVELSLDQGVQTLYTGDLAKRDGDGYFYITGRKSRFIKMQGKRISLAHLEETLKERGVTENACLGQEDKLVIAYANSQHQSTIVAYLQELSVHPAFYQLILLDRIPYTNSGKVDYPLLKREARWL